MKRGYCNNGDSCSWVHPSPEVLADDADQICRGWVMFGRCQRGESCNWVHPVNQVPVWVPVEMLSSQAQGVQQRPVRPMLMSPWVAQACGDPQVALQAEQDALSCGVCNQSVTEVRGEALVSSSPSAMMSQHTNQRKLKPKLPEYKVPDTNQKWKRSSGIRWEDVSDSEDCSTDCSGSL